MMGCKPQTQKPILAPAGKFPEAIYIKTHQQTFNMLFFFALDEAGKIWVKPIEQRKETEGFAPGWQLFGTGLPANPEKEGFAQPKKIVEMNADSDELMVLSDTGRYYFIRWLPNPFFPGEPTVWQDVFGWPLGEPYVREDRIQKNRGWGIGRRGLLMDYFEDANGKMIWGGGGLSSYYHLAADGTDVHFADSGLPADFSHTLCGPRRSTVIGEGFDVAGSTMFVINKKGEIFTRMADFDTNGSDIMFFEYTYDQSNKKKSLITIPSEEWLQHASIPLTGKAQITSQLSILITGLGNPGRELRVAGFNAEGKKGYYYKKIFNQKPDSREREMINEWSFKEVADLQIDPAKVLSTEYINSTAPAVDAPSKDINYSGWMSDKKKRIPVKVELLGMSLSCTPATLRISHMGESIDLTLHTVEEWYHLKRVDPGKDGTPKKLIGTLEVPTEAYQKASPRMKKILDKYLMPYHLKDFAFWMDATTEYVALENRLSGWGIQGITMGMTRSGMDYPSLAVAQREALEKEGFKALAKTKTLQVDRPLKEFTALDIEQLLQKIETNQATLQNLHDMFGAADRADEETPFFITRVGVLALKAIGSVLGGISYWAPYASNLMKTLPVLIIKNQELKKTIMLNSRDDYQLGVAIINARIKAYQRRLAELEGKIEHSEWVHFEAISEFWAPMEFGKVSARVTDVSTGKEVQNCTAIVDDKPVMDESARNWMGRDLGEAALLQVICTGKEAGSLVFRVAPQNKEIEKYLFIDAPIADPLKIELAVELQLYQTSFESRSVYEKVFQTEDERKSEKTLSALLTVEQGRRYSVRVGNLQVNWEK